MLSTFINNLFTKKNFYFLLFLIAFIWFMVKNPDVAFMLFASIAFTCALMPITEKLSKKMPRPLAATIVLTGLILILAIFVVPILMLGAYELNEFISQFPNYVDKLGDTKLSTDLFSKLHIPTPTIDNLMTQFANSTSGIIDTLIEFVKSISSTLLYIFMAIVFIFIMLVDREVLREGFLKIFPSEMRNKTKEIFTNISNKLGGYIIAQIVVSGSVWIVMTIGLLIFKIDYAVVLGLIAGILSLIPVLGSGISLVICLIATYQSGIMPMVIVAIMFTLSHFIENHVVRPYVYSKFLKLHPIIVFLALFVGGKYAGVVGVLFAPPIAMALCILFEELYIKRMDG